MTRTESRARELDDEQLMQALGALISRADPCPERVPQDAGGLLTWGAVEAELAGLLGPPPKV
jgi:hypothetical protein